MSIGTGEHFSARAGDVVDGLTKSRTQSLNICVPGNEHHKHQLFQGVFEVPVPFQSR